MQKLRKNIIIVFGFQIFVFSFLLMPLYAQAQAVSDPLQYIVAPEVPGPNQLVLLEVQGVGSFLGNASISWSKDGVVEKSGAGARTYSFTTKELGQPTRIRVAIQSDTNGSYSKEFIFIPSLVNLVWEADTTVPPFYRGKALYSAGSPLKVAAFPIVFSGGLQIAPSALSYQWSHNDEPVPEASGLGHSTFSFDGDLLQTQETVSVDVYYGRARVARGEIAVAAVEPGILLYARDPLRGTEWNRALPAGIQLNASEITLQAAPYYFSAASFRAGQLGFNWTLEGEPVVGPSSAYGILTLRQAGAGQGSAMVEVSAENRDSNAFTQLARQGLQIVFGQQNSSLLSSFFGL